jgi:hypothetical protein
MAREEFLSRVVETLRPAGAFNSRLGYYYLEGDASGRRGSAPDEFGGYFSTSLCLGKEAGGRGRGVSVLALRESFNITLGAGEHFDREGYVSGELWTMQVRLARDLEPVVVILNRELRRITFASGSGKKLQRRADDATAAKYFAEMRVAINAA